jgi:hypothetical protein
VTRSGPQPDGVPRRPGASGQPWPQHPADARGALGEWLAPLIGRAGPDVAGSGGPPTAGPDVAGSDAPPTAGPDVAGSGGPPAGPIPPLPEAETAVTAPSSVCDATRMVLTGLGWLAGHDVASIPAPVQAECLRALEAAMSMHAAARANVISAFCAQRGYEADGQGSPRTWLCWQTRVTRSAACAVLASARRLNEHQAVAAALAAAEISVSWARQICEWSDSFPADVRDDADLILLAAARGGADLAGLSELAEEIRSRTAAPDRDRGDGFADRGLRLGVTLGGSARLHADLTPRAAAALRAVLDGLGQKSGPEDTRTTAQRDHDALEEACMRLLASRCLPERAGQPVQLQLHLSLDDLLRGAGSSSGGTGGTAPFPGGWPGPAAGPGDDCDAAVAPIVTGRVDYDLLDRLAGRLARSGRLGLAKADSGLGPAGGLDKAAAARQILERAVALLSGPSGLASWLRTGTLPPPAASVSLPLDVGAVTDCVPPHLRRAITARDRHCAAPGCDKPSAACHVHHIIPRSRGGPTSLANCLLLCSFHHLIVIHRWGWSIALNPNGTTTLTSPGGRTLRSHHPRC